MFTFTIVLFACIYHYLMADEHRNEWAVRFGIHVDDEHDARDDLHNARDDEHDVGDGVDIQAWLDGVAAAAEEVDEWDEGNGWADGGAWEWADGGPWE